MNASLSGWKERGIKSVWFIAALTAAAAVVFILGYLLITSLPVFTEIGIAGFLLNTDWNPAGAAPSYGILALIVNTLLVSAGAMLIAVPLGLLSAIFLAYLAPARLRSVVKPAIELLAGIPSIVYGFFGMVVLCSVLQSVFHLASGFSWAAASILLGIMALPTIVSVSEDALTAVPKEYREASLGLGATRWQTISRVLVPAAASGITAAVILGIGRALGETMAVLMVAGNSALIPSPLWDITAPVRTLTSTLGIELAETASGTMHYYALFGIAVVLLLITLCVNLIAMQITRRIKTGRKILPVSMPYLRLPVSGFRLVSPAVSEKIAFACIIAGCGLVVLTLVVILGTIFVNGIPALSWEFLTTAPRDLGRDGGIFPAIVGTLQLVCGAILLALPVGIGSAVYLHEYARDGPAVRLLRTGIDLLAGTPSIVFGVFGFAFLVVYLGWGVCLAAGIICLALMVLPTIVRTTEEALASVPQSLREASLGLGATRWQTIRHAVLPAAAPGILTGTILAIGRAAGETAPIMFVAVVFTKRFLTLNLMEPVSALPFHLYVLATTVPGSEPQQYATAVVLIMMVAFFYAAAIIIRTRCRKNLA